MIQYIYKYESISKETTPELSSKQIFWNQIVPELEQRLTSGKGYELSVIRDHLNNLKEQCEFRNRDVKIVSINQFGNAIDFTCPIHFANA